MINKIDQAARDWEKTKDPKHKQEWYDLIKKFNKEQIHTFTCRGCKADMKPGEMSRIKGYCMDC
jgi:hypothetical protein